MFSKTSLVALAAIPSAFAAISITAPVLSTSWAAGAQQTLQWMDDGTTPSLKDFGASEVSIYVGNVNVQTQLQQIVPSVDVSTTGSIAFTPDPSIGPTGDFYFIRFQSLNLTDPKNPQFPAEAFSAKFTLTAMTGQFNSTVQQEIDAASTAPLGGAPTSSASSSAAPTSSSAASSNSSPTSSASKSASTSASATGAAKQQDNGARGVLASAGLVGTVAAFIGSMML